MDIDEALEIVLSDERSNIVPALCVVQILIICEDNKLFKDENGRNVE